MISIIKKWILWAVGAALILLGAFFMAPVPEGDPVPAETAAGESTAGESTAAEDIPSADRPDAEPGAEERPDGKKEAETAAAEASGQKEPEEEEAPKYRQNGRTTRRGRKGRSCSRDDGHGPGVPPEEKGPDPVDPDLVWIASDTHYVSPKMTDYGEAFRERLDRDDGKDLEDIDLVLDTWIDEVLKARPATVILSGDLVMDGETVNHIELEQKLRRLTEDGIQVLVIPGNHDIRVTYWASSYAGAVRTDAATPMTAEEFLEIWHGCGYDQAAERDETSLSYLYKVDEKHWFLMLDSAIYEPETLVTGRIRETTLLWMEDILKRAAEEGARVIPVAHHNLLSESRLYRTDCTLENHKDVVELLDQYDVPLWFSGHLHLQRIRSYLPEPGADPEDRITEIVSGCFAMYPFPYGVLRLEGEGGMEYQCRTVELPESVRQNGLDEFRYVIQRQTSGKIRGLPDYIINNMAESYAGLLGKYVAGEVVDAAAFRQELGYRMMQKYINPEDSDLPRRIESILGDTRKDARYWKGAE